MLDTREIRLLVLHVPRSTSIDTEDMLPGDTHTKAYLVYTLNIHMWECLSTQITEKNLEYPQGHSTSGLILLSSGARQDGGSLVTMLYIHTYIYIYICIYIFLYIRAFTPLAYKMTGLLLSVTRGDWFPICWWRWCLPWEWPGRYSDKVVILWGAFIWVPCVSFCSSGLLQMGWWPMWGLPESSLAEDYLGFPSHHCLSAPLWVCR